MKWKERAVLFKFNYHYFKIYLPLHYQQGTNSHWLTVWCELESLNIQIQLGILFMITELPSSLTSRLQWLGMWANPNLETFVIFLFYFVVCFCIELCWSALSMAFLHFPQLSQSRGLQYWGVIRCVSVCRWFQRYVVKKRVLYIMKDSVLFAVRCLHGLNVLLRKFRKLLFITANKRNQKEFKSPWMGCIPWCIRVLVDKVKLELAIFNHCLLVWASGSMKEKYQPHKCLTMVST